MEPTNDPPATASDLERVTARVRRTVAWALSAVGVSLVLGVLVAVAAAFLAGALAGTGALGAVGLVAGVLAAGVSLVLASAFVPAD